MIVVHHLENSRSHRIVWLLEEIGAEFEIKIYRRDSITLLAPPELRGIHPLGKSPVIIDDDVTLAKSGAIIEYLLAKYPASNLAPASGTPDWIRYVHWLHFAEGSAMPPLLLKLVFDRIENAPIPWPARIVSGTIARRTKSQFIGPRISDNLDYMEAALGRSEWFAGNTFSAADIQMSYPVEASLQRGGSATKLTKLIEFLERIHARPAYERALRREGGHKIVG